MAAQREIETLIENARRELRDRRRWIERPWEFAFDVIGHEALDKAARSGGGAVHPVREFSLEQREYLAAFCDLSLLGTILKSGRYGTKTWLMALGIATCAYSVPGFTATVNAGSFAQSQVLYRYFEWFATSQKFATCLEGPPTKTQTRLRGGGWISSLTAGPRAATGPHPYMLVVDEACLMSEDILELVMGQRSAAGLVRISSTPYKRYHRFRDWFYSESGWRKFSWGRRRVLPDGSWEPTFPWDSREVIEDEIASHDSNWVRIHIDGEFGSPTGAVFSPDDIEAARIEDPLRRPLPEGFDPARIDLLYNEEAVASSRIGMDWGFENPTVITVTHRVQVPPEAAERLGLRRPEIYYVVHVEGGSQRSEDHWYKRVGDLLRDERLRGDVYPDASHIFQNKAVARIAAPFRASCVPIPFSRDKMQMVGWTNMLLEQGALRIPRRFVETLEQLAYYEWAEGREKPAKGNDDYVDSLMLSLWGHRLGAGAPGAARITLRRPGR